MATQGKESKEAGGRQEGGGKRRRSLLGKKLGMTQLFESGQWVPVTVLQAGPCTILQVKTLETDGYEAVQLGFDETSKPRKWPQQARLEKLGLKPLRFVKEVPFVDPQELLSAEEMESAARKAAERAASEEKRKDDAGGGEGGAEEGRGEPEAVEPSGSAGAAEEGAAAKEGEAQQPEEPREPKEPAPGLLVGAALFKGVPRVDVRGRTKGRGFAGVIRRHHFNSGPKSHGTKNIREPGSTGMHTDPARVLPGKKMPGHLGSVFRKARNLDVVRVVEEDNLLVVKGSVPGPNGSYVYIEESLE